MAPKPAWSLDNLFECCVGWLVTDFHAVRPLEEAGGGEGSVRSPERDGQVLQHLTRRTQVRTHLMSQHADLKT